MTRRRNILTGTAAAGIIAAAALTGCNTNTSPGEEPTPVSTPSQSTVSDYPSTDITTEDFSTPVVKLGETYTYDDGLTVTVTEWGTDPAGDYGPIGQIVPPGAPVPVYQIAIGNGTSDPFDPAMVNASVTDTSTGNSADPLFTDNSSGFSWGGMILPGQTAVHRTGYDVDPASPTSITVSIDYNRMPLIVDNTQ